ncbi:Pilus assembly protein, ATPase of CpaF family [Paenibacillus sp. yr247]|uniref:ATPase, T2SS/T4P/T4SS family n=1 Tax=Paenibacillus sp. yr247 TaxID=1761880 RepID=UPI000885682C|nr:ATPase, T2SS/T4P/T4SS family [Paenibacillus sp. yr247]SDO15648.1 Pilus assembly protein, ATPase of CpaF family [Paenibacillus sp. yr247]
MNPDTLFKLEEQTEIQFHEIVDYMKNGTDAKNPQAQGYANQQFRFAVGIVNDFFDKRLTNAKTTDEKKKYQNQQHHATRGRPEEVNEMKRIIQQIIEQSQLHDMPFPSIYLNLVDALFHETWGFGVVSVWLEQHREVGKCRLNGTEVWYKKPGERHRIHEQYRDIKEVYRLIDNLVLNDEGVVLSRDTPYAELQLYDGTRVVITIPPICRVPTIVFRRTTVALYTLNEQAKLKTIDSEAIPIYQMMARCGCKIVLSGEPGVGKTTFLLSTFAETHSDHITVAAENAFEMMLKARFLDRDITEFVGDDKTMVPVIFPRTLRQDPKIYMIGEIREVEAPMYKEAARNSTGFVGTTMHEYDSTNVPGTLARKEIRHVNGLNYRIALTDYASVIDFVLIMELDEDQTTIRNAEISEIRFDPLNLSVTSKRIMLFDEDTKIWLYDAEIDDQLLRRMKKKDRHAYAAGMKTLERLAEDRPIPKDRLSKSLSWGESSGRGD